MLALIVAAVVARSVVDPPEAVAQSLGSLERASLQLLFLEPELKLEALMPRELTGDAPALAQPLGPWRFGAQAGDMGGATRFSRTVPVLWRARVRAIPGRGELRAQHSVSGRDGRAGCLSHVAHAQSRICIEAQSLGPVVVTNDGEWLELQGGVRLDFDLSQVQRAGQYQGTMILTLSQL